MKNDFRLDRTCFQAMTLKEADKEMTDYSQFSWQERLVVANYLNSIAYNFSLNHPPAMDKGIFAARKSAKWLTSSMLTLETSLQL